MGPGAVSPLLGSRWKEMLTPAVGESSCYTPITVKKDGVTPKKRQSWKPGLCRYALIWPVLRCYTSWSDQFHVVQKKSTGPTRPCRVRWFSGVISLSRPHGCSFWSTYPSGINSSCGMTKGCQVTTHLRRVLQDGATLAARVLVKSKHVRIN